MRKQRQALVTIKGEQKIIDISDYESCVLYALVERIRNEYKTNDFIITDILERRSNI